MHALDRLYRSLIWNNFFHNGFGDHQLLERMLELKNNVQKILPLNKKLKDVDLEKPVVTKTHTIWNGTLLSPLEQISPGLLPPNAGRVRFQLILPLDSGKRFAEAHLQQLNSQTQLQEHNSHSTTQHPVFVHLPATGDHGFWRRRQLHAIPLVQRYGIGSLLLETPLYGSRRPPEQIRSNLRFVTDLYLMGLGIMYETVPLLDWLEERGLGPFGVGGFSMGGYMSSIVATVYEKPVALVSFLGPFTASGVFCRGLLSASCNWRALKQELMKQFPGATPNPVDYLRSQLDSVTSIHTYAPPVSTRASIVFAARKDGYVPLEDVEAFKKHWPGVDLRYLDNDGHISSFLFNNHLYLSAVVEALERLGYQPNQISRPSSNSAFRPPTMASL